MERCMITHSLLSAWLYAMKENPYEDATTERDPMDDFIRTLRREPTETTEAMQNGIEFEELIAAIINGRSSFGFEAVTAPGEFPGLGFAGIEEHKWYAAAKKAADVLTGGRLQYKASKEINVAGRPILLYGRLDCLKCGSIIDTKFSKSYDRGKYFDSTQHPMYMEIVPEAGRFIYLVSNGTDVWTEEYRRDETPSIYPIISDFLGWLAAQGWLKEFEKKWRAK